MKEPSVNTKDELKENVSVRKSISFSENPQLESQPESGEIYLLT